MLYFIYMIIIFKKVKCDYVLIFNGCVYFYYNVCEVGFFLNKCIINNLVFCDLKIMVCEKR